MKVYVVIHNDYSQTALEAVYASIEAAARAMPNERWEALPGAPGYWHSLGDKAKGRLDAEYSIIECEVIDIAWERCGEPDLYDLGGCHLRKGHLDSHEATNNIDTYIWRYSFG